MPRIHRIGCAEIWGGNRGDELLVETSGVKACLFSRACDGGKGGDIYYISVCEGDLLTRIAIADVVGHGEAVSLTSGWLYDSLAARMNTGDGNLVLEDLNRATVEKGLEAMSTATVAAFYRANRELFFSYAGHHQLLILHHGQSEWNSLDVDRGTELSGLPLGVDEDCVFHQHSIISSLGDRLFLYTDGVIEAMDANGKLFGFDRLLAVLNRFDSGTELTQIRQAVVDAVTNHTGGSLNHDDVTFMVIEFAKTTDGTGGTNP